MTTSQTGKNETPTTMQHQLISRDTIKPARPTPKHQRILKPSLLDEFSPHVYVRIIFFYTNEPHDNLPPKVLDPNELKKSLSETLARYYPFAGRIKEGYIDCNDEGIEFLTTHINSKLADILEQPQIETLSKLLPISGDEALNGSDSNSLVVIQINMFECGGMALGTCFSHKIADACSIATFMTDWAALTTDPNTTQVSPLFIGASLFPTKDQASFSPKSLKADENCSSRRLVFHGSKVDDLKDVIIGKASCKDVLHPTRFEAATALIYRCVKSVSKGTGLHGPECLNITVNLRKRMVPSLSGNHIGNFAVHNLIEIGDDNPVLHDLVILLKQGMAEFCKKYAGNDTSSEIQRSYQEMDQFLHDKQKAMLLFSSWCRFPFYEVDFGSGKPAWICNLPNPTKNCIFLYDTRNGDGLEAWVSLEDHVMAIFEHNQDLLTFASLNPCPLESEN